MQRLNSGGWICCLNEVEDVKARLLCFTYEGGDADYFLRWEPLLRSGVELVSVVLPGRAQRKDELLPASVEQIVDGLIEASGKLLEKPFIAFGHGLGASLAYETVCKLSRLDWILPKRLIVSGCQAPIDKGIYYSHISDLDDQSFFEALYEHDCIASQLMENPEAVAEKLAVIRSDFGLRETYNATDDQVLNLPIDVFAGSRDLIPLGNLLEWQKASRHTVHVCVFKGNHFFIEQDRISLLNHINELFDEIIVTSAYA